MPAPRSSLRVAFDLPSAVPGVWHADALGAGLQSAQPTGFVQLDAQLPGGGWPVGALSEVLQPMAGLHEWQLVLPALAQAYADHIRSLPAMQKWIAGANTERDFLVSQEPYRHVPDFADPIMVTGGH